MAKLAAYFLVGPTAVGKSEAAQWIAERNDFDILSADSMMVYRGMDIGTAKPTAAQRATARYWCIDLVAPRHPFSAWNYRNAASKALQLIIEAGRQAIVVGGTGLYVKSLTDGLLPLPGGNPELRRLLNDTLEAQGVQALQKILRQKSPTAFKSLHDKENPRRLMRAIELAEAGTSPDRKTWKRGETVPLVGLYRPTQELAARIEQRVHHMYRSGLLEEARRIMADGIESAPTARQAIGYAEAIACLQGHCSREDAMAKTVIRTRQLAKRQMTWFRHQANVKWITVDASSKIQDIGESVLAHWRRHGPTAVAG